MATIKQWFQPEEYQALATNFPQYVKNLGTNFPISALAYDPTTKQTAFFKLKSFNYGSGNLTLIIRWYADTASSGDIIWGSQIAAITPDTDTQDVETKALATANTVTDTHLGTTGQREHTCTITISNLDSIATDDTVWLAVYRDAAAGGDTMTGLAFLLEMELQYSDT